MSRVASWVIVRRVAGERGWPTPCPPGVDSFARRLLVSAALQTSESLCVTELHHVEVLACSPSGGALSSAPHPPRLPPYGRALIRLPSLAVAAPLMRGTSPLGIGNQFALFPHLKHVLVPDAEEQPLIMISANAHGT